MKHFVKFLFLFMLFIHLPVSSIADNSYLASVQAIIDNGKTPEGVVFEIVNRDKQYLNWALPEAERLSSQLRNKFPSLDIAIVTHGSEQFALTKVQLAKNAALNDTVMSLNKSDVQVHVCGTHAERKGVAAEEFSELVDVTAEGPAQINDYIKLGYEKIRLVK